MFWKKHDTTTGAGSGGGGSYTQRTALDADVWGPHYWFFLHTLAYAYPDFPTAVTKRKYYDFVMNLPLFIPVPKMGADFEHILDEFPVSPYLVNRESFMRWVNVVHNQYNLQRAKEPVPFHESVHLYLKNYAPSPVVRSHFDRKYTVRVLYLGFIVLLLVAICWFCFCYL